jgi:hypothetical protein
MGHHPGPTGYGGQPLRPVGLIERFAGLPPSDGKEIDHGAESVLLPALGAEKPSIMALRVGPVSRTILIRDLWMTSPIDTFPFKFIDLQIHN